MAATKTTDLAAVTQAAVVAKNDLLALVSAAAGPGSRKVLVKDLAIGVLRELGVPYYATVASLPTGFGAPAAGAMAYCANARKTVASVLEGVGAGTGALVRYDGTVWKIVDTGANVQA